MGFKYSEKLNKPIKTYHVTQHKYKYPYINPKEDISDLGFAGNAYGTGFYTTDDKDVLEGYKKNLINPIVRKQKIPRGATILNYNSLSPQWVEKINNLILYIFPTKYNEIINFNNIRNIFEIIKIYNLNDNEKQQLFSKINSYLLDKGIDVIKYNPGNIYKNDYKGYNYLIINNKIINKDKKDEKFNEELKYKNLDKLNRILRIPEYSSNIIFKDLVFVSQKYPEKLDELLNSDISINTRVMIILLKKDFDMLIPLLKINPKEIIECITTFAINHNVVEPLQFLYRNIKDTQYLNYEITQVLELYDNLSTNFINKYKHLFPEPLLNYLKNKDSKIIKLCKEGTWRDIDEIVKFYKENENDQDKIKEIIKTNKKLLPFFVEEIPYLDQSFAQPILDIMGSIYSSEMFNILSRNKQIFTKEQLKQIIDFYPDASNLNHFQRIIKHD